MVIPGDGFNYFLRHQLQFELFFKLWSIRTFAAKGLDVEYDPRRIHNGFLLWKDRAGLWGRELVQRRADDIEPENRSWMPLDEACEKLSHNKQAGTLLWALNRVQPISNMHILSSERRDILRSRGFAVPHGVIASERLSRYYNEVTCFSFVQHVFWAIQAGRDLPRRVDLNAPPMTSHFLENICYLLRNKDPLPDNLYMIFKSFDLFSLVHSE